MASETITLKLVAQDLASGNISKAIAGIDKMAQRGGILGSVFQGVGLSIGQAINPVALVGRAIDTVTDVMGDAVSAALKEEESVKLLTQAIEANDEAWDGNIAAIEDVLKARMDLGYSDDEQRESLRQLVAVTKDTTEALDLQRTAMDLARLRGMSLADASLLLGKVYGGNIGILSRYGIQLEKGTTATEALAEIQRRASGQAETYADTTRGKLTRAQVQLDEAMEALGKTMLPLVADFADLAAKVIPDLVGFVGELGTQFNNLNRFLQPHVALLQDAEKYALAAGKAYGLEADQVKYLVEQQQRLNDELERTERVRDAIARVEAPDTQTLEGVEQLVENIVTLNKLQLRPDLSALAPMGDMLMAQATTIAKTLDLNLAWTMSVLNMGLTAKETAAILYSADATLRGFNEGVGQSNESVTLGAQAIDIYASGLYALAGPTNQLILQNQAAAKSLDKTGVAATDLGEKLGEELPYAMRMAKKAVISDLSTLPQGMASIIKDGKETVREAMTELRWAMEHPFAEEKYANWLEKRAEKANEKLTAAIAAGNIPAANAARALVDAIEAELATIDDRTYNVDVVVDTTTGRRRVGGAPGRAAGGPVYPGQSYLVGERGPEMFTPTGAGYVTPNGGGGNFVYAPTFSSASPAEAQRFAMAITPYVERERRRIA